MLELKKGVDILSEVGGVKTLDEAKALFAEKFDQENLGKLNQIKNEEALLKIANAVSMMQPDSVFVNTGSAEDVQTIREMSLAKGEEAALAMPGHTIHFDYVKEQGRVVDKTLYIVNEDEAISEMARKQLRSESLAYIKEHMSGIAKGKTLFSWVLQPWSGWRKSILAGYRNHHVDLCGPLRQYLISQRLRSV